MKKVIGLLCCVILGASPLAFAQDKAKDAEKKSATATEKSKKEPTEKQKAQQARMKACNTQAGERERDANCDDVEPERSEQDRIQVKKGRRVGGCEVHVWQVAVEDATRRVEEIAFVERV